MDRMMNQMMGMGNMFHHDPFSMAPFAMRPPQLNFPVMPNMMPNMMTMMNPASMSNSPGTFVSSSFVSFSNDGVNPPQVYEQTNSNRVGPGGVREERRTVRDSRSGLQQMSIGRHIHDRGHVMERSRNNRTGEQEENDEYINIEEEEAPEFNQEWNSRMASSSNNRPQNYVQAARREPVLAITGPETSYSLSDSHNRNSVDKKLRIKPTSMKKDKKVKKAYRKE